MNASVPKYRTLVCFVAGLLTITASAEESAYQITRSVFGGNAVAHGSDFTLAGPSGQILAGRLSGDSFELDNGFWFDIPAGDCGADGFADLPDHSLFSECINGPGGAGPEEHCHCFDIDRNQSVDLRDYAQMQVAFTGS